MTEWGGSGTHYCLSRGGKRWGASQRLLGSCSTQWKRERETERNGKGYNSPPSSMLSVRYFSGCGVGISGRASDVCSGSDRDIRGVTTLSRLGSVIGSDTLSHWKCGRVSFSTDSSPDPSPAPPRPAIPQQVLDLNLQGQAYITAGMLDEAKEAFHEAVALISSSTSNDSHSSMPSPAEGGILAQPERVEEGEDGIDRDSSTALVGSAFFFDIDDSVTAISPEILRIVEDSRNADPNVTTLLRSDPRRHTIAQTHTHHTHSLRALLSLSFSS